jgi:flagellar protein FliO/FliZ
MDSAPHLITVGFSALSMRLRRGAIVTGLLLALGARPECAAAADETTIFTPGTSRSATPEMSGSGFGSVSLVLGLLLAGAGGWLLWRQRRGAPVGRELRALAIDETRSLGNRQFLVVASYEGRKFLLGVCPGRIDMLTPLDGTAPREKARE